MTRMRPASPPSPGQRYATYDANALAMAAAAASRERKNAQPTWNATNGPKAARAYRYGPPVRSKRLPASAKHATTSAATTAASRYATGLDGPSSAATVAGSTKMPEPMTPLTAMAVRPGSPMVLMSRGGGGLAMGQALFRIDRAVPLKIRCFSSSGIASASIDETARSIE